MAVSPSEYSVREALNLACNGMYYYCTAGVRGVTCTLIPSAGTRKILKRLIVSSTTAAPSLTLKAYNDITFPTPFFNGNFGHRDSDNAIRFPLGESCTSEWYVLVSGATEPIYILAEYD